MSGASDSEVNMKVCFRGIHNLVCSRWAVMVEMWNHCWGSAKLGAGIRLKWSFSVEMGLSLVGEGGRFHWVEVAERILTWAACKKMEKPEYSIFISFVFWSILYVLSVLRWQKRQASFHGGWLEDFKQVVCSNLQFWKGAW